MKNMRKFSTYFVILQTNISDVYCDSYLKINTDPADDLEKTLNMRNVAILIKSVFDKNHNHFYYKAVLERCSYK